jgi:hypothetical protein
MADRPGASAAFREAIKAPIVTAAMSTPPIQTDAAAMWNALSQR